MVNITPKPMNVLIRIIERRTAMDWDALDCLESYCIGHDDEWTGTDYKWTETDEEGEQQ